MWGGISARVGRVRYNRVVLGVVRTVGWVGWVVGGGVGFGLVIKIGIIYTTLP